LFSKLISQMWPHPGAVAKRCKEIHHAAIKLKDDDQQLILKFQTTGKTKYKDPIPRARELSPHGISEKVVASSFFGKMPKGAADSYGRRSPPNGEALVAQTPTNIEKPRPEQTISLEVETEA